MFYMKKTLFLSNLSLSAASIPTVFSSTTEFFDKNDFKCINVCWALRGKLKNITDRHNHTYSDHHEKNHNVIVFFNQDPNV